MTMTRSRKIWITVGVVLLFVFVILPGVAYLLFVVGPCQPKDEYRHLVFENQMPTDVTILNQDFNEDGEQIYEETLGTVPAGQTENLTLVIPFPKLKGRTADSIKRSLLATIQVTADDLAGNVVWQKSWSMNEFYDLRKEGWRIVISPETDGQEGN